jgi:hypothetical protein
MDERGGPLVAAVYRLKVGGRDDRQSAVGAIQAAAHLYNEVLARPEVPCLNDYLVTGCL